MVPMDEGHQGEDMIRAKVFGKTTQNRQTVNDSGVENDQNGF